MRRNILPIIFGLLLASLAFNAYLITGVFNKPIKLVRPVPNSIDYSEQVLSESTQNIEVSDDLDSSNKNRISTYDRVQIQKKFEKLSKSIVERDGIYSLYIKDLNTGFNLSFNKFYKHYGASLYKIPVAITTLVYIESDDIELEDEVIYEKDDYSEGTGEIKSSKYGSVYSVETLLDKLIRDSDNVAQNLLLKLVSFNDIAKVFPESANNRKFPVVLEVTVTEIIELLENLYEGEFLKDENTLKLLSFMSSTSFDDRISVGLDDEIKFAHKIGNDPDSSSWHDCGIATKADRAIVVCLMSSKTNFDDFLNASKLVGEFMSELFEY